LLLITAAKSALADINYVPSGSMRPTILEGDVLFINKLAYDLRVPFTTLRVATWENPRRGDIVVCFSPADGTRLVKRIVALPGDVVELQGGALLINGQPRDYAPLTAASIRYASATERAHASFARESDDHDGHAIMALRGMPAVRHTAPLRVPEGHYFALGDNRDNSQDSRFFGTVPRHQIVGEATTVVASADLTAWLKPRVDRFFTALD
jgi:signal peptidase I